MPTAVEIYTDGACRGNPGPGGWGAVLSSREHVKELRGAELLTTNNRMLWMALPYTVTMTLTGLWAVAYLI